MRRSGAPLLIALFALACGAPAPLPEAPDANAPREPAALAAPVSLAPGDVLEVTGEGGSFSVALATPTGKERFVVVVGSTLLDGADASYRYRLLEPAAGAPSRSAKVACSAPSGRWKTAARAGASIDGGSPKRAAASPIAPSATRTFTWKTRSGTMPFTARAVAVGESTIVWADESAHHKAELDPAFVTEFQRDFEAVILRRARAVFGPESDIDGDGRIALLFSPMTRVAATVAFFSGCDLAPKSACPGSNEGEVLYLTPPNAIDPPYNTPRAMKEILAHELEHLIHHNRKVVRNKLAGDPDSAYLLEGFGALAQDVLGFQAGNLYVTKAGLDDIDALSLGAVLTEGAEYDRARDGALRGGAYLFVRWLYDQAGGDAPGDGSAVVDQGGPSLVRALLDARDPIAAEIPRAVGASLPDLAMDFFTALALSSRGLPVPPCFTYLPTARDPITGRQRGADLFAEFHGMRMQGVRVAPAASVDGALRAGGVEYIALGGEGTKASASISFTVAVDAAARPRVRVTRVE